MYRILKKCELTKNIYLMDVEAKRVAKACQPGQFVIVRMDAEGERIPLTICDYDREKGTVTIVFQCVGAETHRMVSLEEGKGDAGRAEKEKNSLCGRRCGRRAGISPGEMAP